METILIMPILIILFYIFLLIAFVYFIIKRINDKENEDFEKRNN